MKYSLRPRQFPRDFPRALAIFHSISQLESHYRHFQWQLPNKECQCKNTTPLKSMEFWIIMSGNGPFMESILTINLGAIVCYLTQRINTRK